MCLRVWYREPRVCRGVYTCDSARTAVRLREHGGRSVCGCAWVHRDLCTDVYECACVCMHARLCSGACLCGCARVHV